MESLASYFTPSGRIARKPFAIGVIVVYVLIFFSQTLLAPPVTGRAGIAPFAILQMALAWGWFALHAGRLRDAGRSTGSAAGIAMLYVLAMVLLLLLVTLLIDVSAAGDADDQAGSFASVFIILFLLVLLTGNLSVSFFFYVALGLLLAILLPLLIALGFSIWAATLPPASP